MSALANYFNIENISNFIIRHKWTLYGLLSVAVGTYLTKVFYIAGGVCKSKARLDGKTVIITGANTGIGKETALDLAKRGARVILACRDVKKAVKVAEQIRAKSGNGNVLVEFLDLASFDSIKRFAAKINDQEERLDILINNAAMMACPKWKTIEGFEMQFGVNHLGHFLLTNLLLDKLKKSAPSRIVIVSAKAYEWARIDWNDLMSDRDYEPWKVYQKSKIANILFTIELAKRLKGSGVTVNALHPGVIRTELGRYIFKSYGFLIGMLMILTRPLQYVFMKTPFEGAQTTIFCAVDESLNNVSGKYFSDCKEKKLLNHASNETDAVKLWQISDELVNSKLNS